MRRFTSGILRSVCYRCGPTLIALCVFLCLAYIFRYPVLENLGSVTMDEDTIQSVDAIVILNGAFPRSVLSAADLFHGGKTSLIVLTQEREWDGIEDLRKRNVLFPSMHDLQKKALIDLKVPEEAMTLLNHVCMRTSDEAYAVRDYLKSHPHIKRIALATRRSQTKRAKIIFRRILGKDITVFATAFQNDPVFANNWYKDVWHFQEVFMELLKHIKLIFN